MITEEYIRAAIESLLDPALDEARFKRVIRGGKIVKKFKARKGFKIIHHGSKITMKRVSVKEKRTKQLAMKRAWRKGKQARVVKSQRKTVRSMKKRNAIFGKSKPKATMR